MIIAIDTTVTTEDRIGVVVVVVVVNRLIVVGDHNNHRRRHNGEVAEIVAETAAEIVATEIATTDGKAVVIKCDDTTIMVVVIQGEFLFSIYRFI